MAKINNFGGETNIFSIQIQFNYLKIFANNQPFLKFLRVCRRMIILI
jgi:hypothetical protein